jgi:hypothetical protein
MQAVRGIQVADTDTVSVRVPKGFRHRRLEVIVIPIDDSPVRTWPAGFFEQTAGCFAGTPLVREDQGAYDVRKEMR